MKKLSLIISVLFVICTFSSCSTKQYLIRGNYEPLITNSIESRMTSEQVISKAITFLAQNGNTIGLIDKQIGLITTTQESFLGKDTQTDKSGNLLDTEAYVVSGVPPKSVTNTNMLGDRIDPYEITGYWSITISNEGSVTKVSITATNLECRYRKVVLGMASSTFVNVPVKSTGVFEGKFLKLFE